LEEQHVSKRKGIGRMGGGMPRPVGGGGAGGMGNIAQQLQKMQVEMQKAQEELGNETIEVSAGGGAVTIVITGHQHIQSIKLKPEIVTPDDVEMLQDVLLAAVNQAIEQSQTMAAQRLDGLTGGLNIPGLS
jgi:DNA-binding YbaB/EbfC family protein